MRHVIYIGIYDITGFGITMWSSDTHTHLGPRHDWHTGMLAWDFYQRLHGPETNSLHVNHWGWKMSFLLGRPPGRCELFVWGHVKLSRIFSRIFGRHTVDGSEIRCHQSSVPIVGFGWIFWLKSCVKFRTAGNAQREHNNLQLWLEQTGNLNEATRLVFFGMQFDVVQDWQLILIGFWNTIPQYSLSLFRNRTNTLSVRNLTKTPNKNTYTLFAFVFFSNVLTFETPSCDVCKRFCPEIFPRQLGSMGCCAATPSAAPHGHLPPQRSLSRLSVGEIELEEEPKSQPRWRWGFVCFLFRRLLFITSIGCYSLKWKDPDRNDPRKFPDF